MSAILSIQNLNKTYEGGFQALKNINLEIRKGEIFALLGPNGAGKTTLISAVCGIINPTSGRILVDGHDIIKDFRKTRERTGLVPQELCTDAFERVWAFRKAGESRLRRGYPKKAEPLGQKVQYDPYPFGRHEEAGDDRQGPCARA